MRLPFYAEIHKSSWLISQVDGWCWWKIRPLRVARALNEKMGEMRSRESQTSVNGVRAGTALPIRLVLGQTVRQRTTPPTSPREREKVHCCTRGAASKCHASGCMHTGKRKHEWRIDLNRVLCFELHELVASVYASLLSIKILDF